MLDILLLMVLLYQTRLCILLLLGAWYISLLHVLILHIMFTLLISLLLLFLDFIRLLFFIFWVFQGTLYESLTFFNFHIKVVCIFRCKLGKWSYWSQIHYEILYIFLWLAYFVEEKSKLLFLILLPKSIMLWLR